MAQSNNPELQALTSLRGIAAIFVMCHHFMFVVMVDVGGLIPSRLFEKSYLWVDLFFILSGFVLAYVYHHTFQNGLAATSYRTFMLARFVRVYPLHLFMVCVFVGYEGLQWFLVNQEVPQGIHHLPPPFSTKQSIDTLVTNLLLIQTLHWQSYWNEPAWSISAEWITYFIVPVTIHQLYRLSENGLVRVAIAALIPLIAIEWHFGDLGLHYAGWPMLVRCFCEASLGIVAFRCYQLGRLQTLASGELLLPVLFLNLVILAVPGPGVPSVIAFAWLVLCASRLPNNRKHVLNEPVLIYLGKISYSIYLVHWLIVDVVRDVGLVLTGTQVHHELTIEIEIFAVTIMSAVTIGLSVLTYHFVELPIRQRFKPQR